MRIIREKGKVNSEESQNVLIANFSLFTFPYSLLMNLDSSVRAF